MTSPICVISSIHNAHNLTSSARIHKILFHTPAVIVYIIYIGPIALSCLKNANSHNHNIKVFVTYK